MNRKLGKAYFAASMKEREDKIGGQLINKWVIHRQHQQWNLGIELLKRSNQTTLDTRRHQEASEGFEKKN